MGSVNVSTSTIPVSDGKSAKRNSLWWDAYYRIKKDKIAVVCFWVIMSYILLAIGCRLGLFFTGFDVTNDAASYMPPGGQYLLGSDFLGRDILSRAAHGTYTSLLVGFFGSGIAVIIGTFFGAIAGYFGGWIDDLVVWFYTTLATIPYILLVVAFSFVMGGGVDVLCLVFGLTGWVGICRVVRGEYMKHRDREYVQAAAAIGGSHFRRAFIHILPNIFHLSLIQFSLGFVSVIKAEVILSYLGIGVEPGTPSWGVMISDAKLELAREIWWGLATAAVFMFILVLAFNLFNDALRDALDPKLKNK